MASPQAEPDPETKAFAFSILRGREAGDTYRVIARDLGISPGKAQHLLADLHEARHEAAHALTRPPTRRYKGHEPDPFEVLGRLRADMRAVEPLLALYPDEEGTFDHALVDGDRIYDDAAGSIRRVLGGKDTTDVTGELGAIDFSFTALLKLAHGLDETLRTEVDASEVLATFHADLLVLAEATGSDLADLEDRWEASERALRPKFRCEPSTVSQPMGPEQRHLRDEAIVRARLSGTPAEAVAARFGVTTRQVRRVMEKHRAGSFAAAPAAIEAAEEGVAEINRQIERLREASEEAETPREKREAIMAMVDLYDKRISIYRQAGLLTPGAFSTSATVSYASRVDLVITINGVIRKALEGHGIEGEIIDDVTDHAVAVSGVDVPGG